MNLSRLSNLVGERGVAGRPPTSSRSGAGDHFRHVTEKRQIPDKFQRSLGAGTADRRKEIGEMKKFPGLAFRLRRLLDRLRLTLQPRHTRKDRPNLLRERLI